MIEIAGFVVSSISLAKDLLALHKDAKSWDQHDLEVDREWLPLAVKNGLLPGDEQSYSWSALRKVPSRELKGTHQLVFAHNDKKKILYRIVQGPTHDRLVLMQKIVSEM